MNRMEVECAVGVLVLLALSRCLLQRASGSLSTRRKCRHALHLLGGTVRDVLKGLRVISSSPGRGVSVRYMVAPFERLRARSGSRKSEIRKIWAGLQKEA